MTLEQQASRYATLQFQRKPRSDEFLKLGQYVFGRSWRRILAGRAGCSIHTIHRYKLGQTPIPEIYLEYLRVMAVMKRTLTRGLHPEPGEDN